MNPQRAKEADVFTKIFYNCANILLATFGIVTSIFFHKALMTMLNCLNEKVQDSFEFSFTPQWIFLLSFVVLSYFLSQLFLNTIKWVMYMMSAVPVFHCLSIWLTPIPHSTIEATNSVDKEKIQLYTAAYIFVRICNEFGCLPLITFMFMAVIVSSTAFALALHGGLTLVSLALCGFAIILVTALNYLVSFGARVHNLSQAYMQELKRSAGLKDLSTNMSTKSLDECRIHCGPFYFVDTGLTPTINDAIINNTIDILLAY